MATIIDGSSGITSPTYGGTVTAEYSVPVTAFKNRIINGDMRIDQRNAGASVTLGGSSYTLDRWYVDSYGSSFNSTTVQQLTSNPPTGFFNYLRIQSGSTTYTNLNLSQAIETKNAYDLAGQLVTISFWYKIPVNWTNQWVAYIAYNTNTDAKVSPGTSGQATVASVTLSNTTSWTKVTLTGTLPSNASTVGILINNGNNNVISGSQFDITGVQLEKGSTATSFDYRPYGTELQLCQRYYETGKEPYSYVQQFSTLAATVAFGDCRFAVTKRASPSITFSGWKYWSVTTATAFTPALDTANVDKFSFNGNPLTSWTGWREDGTWTASAEL